MGVYYNLLCARSDEKYPALRAAKGAHSSARNTLDTAAFATGGPASASPLTGDDSGSAAWKSAFERSRMS
ncbi:hypothetical protein MTO96_038165, partial [Rhipicephalus appendiculatus]